MFLNTKVNIDSGGEIVSAIVEMTNAFATVLWSIVGIIGALLVLWFLWQILQIGKNIREYGNDYIGFLRGEIHKAGEEEGIDIIRPQHGFKDRRSRFKRILDKEPVTVVATDKKE